ncbi:MAG TPA: xanthine dehydrogenase family protein subunit M [Actinomycetes bacterium]|jgi:carbon-monoxide dehydrogenase medium subunit|nr:xanthine dehydrogenase family protein subunit M [Actinomycetes bacterium]
MLPPRFDYLAPRSLDEALEFLDGQGDDAKVLAGGQSLIPVLKLRFAAPAWLVDINRLPGLDGISEQDGHLRMGALVRHRDAERSQVLRERYPTMAEAAPQVSDPLVRNLGTVCGSLAHADPSGDWGAVMLAMDADLVARSKSGTRTIAARDFFDGPFTTALRPDELLVEVRVPDRPRTGGAYLKLERKVGDFATAAVAVRVTMSDGRIGEAGIGLTAVGPNNLKATEAEAVLAGADPSDEAFREAAELAARAASPSADMRGSVEYKRNVVRVFTERGLRRSVAMAIAGGGA